MKAKIKYIFIRLAIYLAIFIVATLLIFFIVNLLLQNQIKKTLAVYSQIESNLGLRFLHWLSRFFTANGKIYSSELNVTNSSISGLFFNQFKITLLFTGLIYIFSIILGNVLGVVAGYKFSKAPDITINIIVSFFAALPLIIIAIIALSTASLFGYPSQYLREYSFASLFVPIMVTSFGTISLFFVRARKKTKEVITSNYYIFAKSLGYNKSQLIRKILIKQLLINQLQAIIPFYIILLSTSIVIERIFSIPGQSIFLSYAFKNAEIDLIMFFFMFSLLVLLISKFVLATLLDYINPMQKSSYFNDFAFIKPRKEKKWKIAN